MTDKYIFKLNRSVAEICFGDNALGSRKAFDEDYSGSFLECVQRQLEAGNQTLEKTHYYNKFRVQEPNEDKLPPITTWFAEDD